MADLIRAIPAYLRFDLIAISSRAAALRSSLTTEICISCPATCVTVSTMRSTVGSTASSRMSAAGSGICGVVMRTGGPSRS